MKTFLSKFDKYWLVGLSFVFVFLSTTIFIQRAEIENLSSRIDTVNANFKRLTSNDSTFVDEIKFIQFKEDSYLKQLDRDTNLILWFIAIVFGVFGVISYASFSSRVRSLTKEFDKKYQSHILELTQLKESLNETKIDLEYESANINVQIAENFFNIGLHKESVFSTLLAESKRSEYFLYHRNKNEALAKSTYNLIIINLNGLLKRLKEYKEKPKMDKESFTIITKNLRKVNKFEILDILSKIHALIEFN